MFNAYKATYARQHGTSAVKHKHARNAVRDKLVEHREEARSKPDSKQNLYFTQQSDADLELQADVFADLMRREVDSWLKTEEESTSGALRNQHSLVHKLLRECDFATQKADEPRVPHERQGEVAWTREKANPRQERSSSVMSAQSHAESTRNTE